MGVSKGQKTISIRTDQFRLRKRSSQESNNSCLIRSNSDLNNVYDTKNLKRFFERSSYKEHMVDALAIGADEGRGKLR